MASIFGHLAIGATFTYQKDRKELKRLLPLSLLFCILPDADVLTFLFGIPYDSLFGHRGFFHSILFCILMGVFGACLLLRKLKLQIKSDWPWILYFFLVSFSHPLLDAMTTGGHGVAFFSPFSLNRYFFKHRTIYVSPIFITKSIDLIALRILAKETAYLLIPCFAWIGARLLLVYWFKERGNKLFWISTTGVFALVAALGHLALVREELVTGINGVDVHELQLMKSEDGKFGIRTLPVNDLPEKRLIWNYSDIFKLGLFNRPLSPKILPWSSNSYPYWVGGAAGRWRSPFLLQVWNALMGSSYLNKSKLLTLLYNAETKKDIHAVSDLEALAPTEKYDLAVGDYHLTATRTETILHGAGSLDTFPKSPFWAGYCTSLSIASISEREPNHQVTVVNPDGFSIRFFPEDIKALLGISYVFFDPQFWKLGERCELEGPKSEACIDVNPGDVVVAIVNRIGLAGASFVLEKEPFSEVQSRPVRQAEVRIINPPYLVNDRKTYFKVHEDFVKYLIDVEINFEVAGIHPFKTAPTKESFSYRATLGLDGEMNIIAGRWEDPFSHPDFIWGGLSTHTQPKVVDERVLGNPLEWSIVKKLVELSSNPHQNETPLKITSVSRDPIQHGLSFEDPSLGISGRVAFVRSAHPIEVFGYVEGKVLSEVGSIELVSIKKTERDAATLAKESVLGNLRDSRFHFRLSTAGALENYETVALQFRMKHPKNESLIRFELPVQKPFQRLEN